MKHLASRDEETIPLRLLVAEQKGDTREVEATCLSLFAMQSRLPQMAIRTMF